MAMKRHYYNLLIILVGLITYGNVFFNGFVWDDQSQIIDNIAIHKLSNIGSFFTGSSFYGGGSEKLVGMYYRPMMTLTFSLLYTIFGAKAFPFHLLSLTLHILNATLVFILFKKFFSKNLSLLLTLLFLVHPIQTEVVNYISALGDTLSFSFGITGLLLIMEKKQVVKTRLVLVGLFFLGSLLSKETGILFLIAAFIYRGLYHKEFVYSTIPIIGSLSIYGFLRLIVAQIRIPLQPFIPIMAASFIEKVMSAPKIFVYYINTFFFP